jgi:hypothetical protein
VGKGVREEGDRLRDNEGLEGERCAGGEEERGRIK